MQSFSATQQPAFVPCLPLRNAHPLQNFSLRTHHRTSAPPIKRARSRPVMTSDTPETDSSEVPNVSGDWREFRAALIAGSAEELERAKQNAYRTGHWAHPLSIPEAGCFLASHPAYYRRSAPYLTQSVVFLSSYDIENGSTGLVLNRPFRGTVAELEQAGIFGRSTNFSTTAFSDQPAYIGGPDTIDSGVLSVLHGDDRLADNCSVIQPLEGVFVGDAMDIIGSAADMSKLRLFAGCLRWKKGELEREVDEGSWYCVSASKLFALEHCIQLPKPLWVEIMQSQGDPFAKIASHVYQEDIEADASE